jgi:hypothetical protein
VRYDLLSAALILFVKHPFFGTGLGTFIVSLPSIAQARDLFFIQPVHNIYVLWLVETGIMSIPILVIGIKKYIQHYFLHTAHVITYIPFVLLLLVGFVDHYPTTVQQGQLLMTLLLALPFMKYPKT